MMMFASFLTTFLIFMTIWKLMVVTGNLGICMPIPVKDVENHSLYENN
jgi:hypothetical protein